MATKTYKKPNIWNENWQKLKVEIESNTILVDFNTLLVIEQLDRR